MSTPSTNFFERKLNEVRNLAKKMIGRALVDVLQLAAAYVLVDQWNKATGAVFCIIAWINVALFMLSQRENEILEFLGFKKSLDLRIWPGWHILNMYTCVLAVATAPLLGLGFVSYVFGKCCDGYLSDDLDNDPEMRGKNDEDQAGTNNPLRDTDISASMEQGQARDRIIKGITSSTTLQEFNSNEISLYRFNKMARENRDVFCFYRVMKGNDRDTFLRYLLAGVNSTNFERHNLVTGGISLEGWFHVMELCAGELEHYYRLFEKQGEDLFYIAAFGKGAIVDIVLCGDHMERVKVVGRYPMITAGHPNRIVYGRPMLDALGRCHGGGIPFDTLQR